MIHLFCDDCINAFGIFINLMGGILRSMAGGVGTKMRSMTVGRGTKCAVWRWERSGLTRGGAGGGKGGSGEGGKSAESNTLLLTSPN